MAIAIVTGANSGIGRGTAVALARRGFDLGLTWHSDEENLRETVAECEAEGVRVEHRQVDLSAVPGPDAVIDELADALGGLDVLVANAAAGHSTPFLEVELEEFEWVIRFALSKDLARWMRPLSLVVFAACIGTIIWSLAAGAVSPWVSALIYLLSAALIVVDFNYLRKHGTENDTIWLATGIFVSIVNIFVSLLNLFQR